MKNTPVFVVSLRSARARRDRIGKALSDSGIDFSFIDAVDGHARDFDAAGFPEYRGRWWKQENAVKPGALACFLSHAKVWKTIIEEHYPGAFILEDDALPVAASGSALSDFLDDLERQSSDAELIFMNSRAVRMLRRSGVDREGVISIREMVDGLLKKAQNPSPEKRLAQLRPPGTYGYFLSRSGARKLLDILDKLGAIWGIDWHLMFCCVSIQDFPDGLPWSSGEFGLNEVSRHIGVALKGYVTSWVWFKHDDGSVGGSTIKHQKIVRVESAQKVRRFRLIESEGYNMPVNFVVKNRRNRVQECHLQGRFYDEEELSWVAENSDGRNNTYIDVGANVGNSTLHALLIRKYRRAVPIEPDPRALRLLRHNINANGLAARVDDRGFGKSLNDVSGIMGRDGRECVRGDELLSDCAVDFIRIDVGGGEAKVLAGLQQTISRCQPNVFVKTGRRDAADLGNFFAERGYRLKGVRHSDGDLEGMLFLPP